MDTSVNPCTSMHEEKWNRVKWNRAQSCQAQSLNRFVERHSCALERATHEFTRVSCVSWAYDIHELSQVLASLLEHLSISSIWHTRVFSSVIEFSQVSYSILHVLSKWRILVLSSFINCCRVLCIYCAYDAHACSWYLFSFLKYSAYLEHVAHTGFLKLYLATSSFL